MASKLERANLPEKLIDRDIIFFDGNCSLCHNLMHILLKADKDKHFLLGAQQSDIGRLVLERHRINVNDLSTVYLVTHCGTDSERVLKRSDAAIYALAHAPAYIWLGKLLALVPRPLRDIGYKVVAHNRYKVFGTTDGACLIASPEDKDRIIS